MPFLAATQVFDLRPEPRKWLVPDRTPSLSERLVEKGQILVTCSGAVGRSTLAYEPHADTIISHDLLRVTPLKDEDWGWIYAFLRSDHAWQMMTGSHYGHIIKHLEVEHLDEIPIPNIARSVKAEFNERAERILSKRSQAHENMKNAEALYQEALGGRLSSHAFDPESGYVQRASDMFYGRRRLEATYFNPRVRAIDRRVAEYAKGTTCLRDATLGVWWLPRFKRSFGGAGVPYMSADDLFTVNPSLEKKILVDPKSDTSRYYVKEGWIMMACSGQAYGLLGSSMLTDVSHEQFFFSHDLIRIRPNIDRIRPGYLLMTLSDPKFGRPAVLRNAYGTSVPHLEPEDIAQCTIPRLARSKEEKIADLVEQATAERTEAAGIERECAERATQLVGDLLGHLGSE